MAGDSKSEACATCAAGASLLSVAAAIMTSNAQITTELAGLHTALGRLAVTQSSSHTASGTPPIMALSDGSGAGSPEDYQEMRERNWHGRLGRTHMVDVDLMLPSGRLELDRYLHRTIKAMFPVGGGYTTINSDTTFATLSAFGLRMEDRGPLAGVSIFTDSTDLQKPTIARLQNYTASYYTTGTPKFVNYWNALAMETLIELAKYRGLFTVEGFLKVVK